MAGQRNSYGKRSHSEYSDNGGSKRRNPGGEKERRSSGDDETVYRYLCQGRRIGSIIGKGGEIVKQLRSETLSKIRIGESLPGCDERVVTIYSTSEETNKYEDGEMICPAQDALFKIFDRMINDESIADEEDAEESREVTVRLLVPSDQIGCVIGKGGDIVQGIRSSTGAAIRILKNEHLPLCAMPSDELLQITGDPSVVKQAMYKLSCRLHDNPSRSQHLLLTSSTASIYHNSPYMGPNGGAPMMGMPPVMGGPYGGYKGESYYGSRDDSSEKEFSLRLVCPTGNIGGVIGKGGLIIKQIRQDTRALIKVDSSSAEGDACLITISSKEYFEDPISPTVDAAVRLQPKCSEKNEKDSGDSSYTTRLLVPSSRIGCLIGKGGAIITDMRRGTRANIRILSKDDLPKVASDDDEMVQISGDLEVAKNALIAVAQKLRANIFDRENALPHYQPPVPYYPMSMDDKYGSKDSKSHSRGYSSYSGGGYGGSSDLPLNDGYGNYGGSHSGGGGYGSYGYSSGRSGSAGLSGSNPISHGKHHGY